MSKEVIDVEQILSDLRDAMNKLEPLVKEYRILRDDIKKLKSERRSITRNLNQKIDVIVENSEKLRGLKKELSYAKYEVKLINDELRSIRNRLNEIRETLRSRPKLTYRTANLMRKELEQLELEYETRNLNARREKRLLEKIKRIQEVLFEYDRYISAKEERKSYIQKRKELISQKESLITKIEGLREEIDHLSKSISDLKGEASVLQKEKMELDNEISKLLNRIEELNRKMSPLKSKRDEILNRFGVKNHNLTFEQISKIVYNRSAILERALKKYQKGRFTFEEFIALAKHGLI